MNPLIILTAATGPGTGSGTRPRAGIRSIQAADIPELSAMYRDSYADSLPQPPERAAGWIEALFAGAEGRPVPEASAVLAGPAGEPAAAIIITEPDAASAAPWDCVIAELFTRPEHRRQGLAEELLGHSLQVLHTSGRARVAVTVDSGNSAALALYLSRDFSRLADDDGA